MRWSNDSRLFTLFFSSKLVQWLLLLLVCVFACTPCVSASVSMPSGRETTVCGTPFVDPESSALLADVVLEGRVRQKIYQPQGPGQVGRYNVTIQIRKKVWKGSQLFPGGEKPKKLLLGTFGSSSEDSADDKNEVVVNDVGGAGVANEEDVLTNCVGDVSDGATYVFFLKDAGDRTGRYFHISALPMKKTRRDVRRVSKILSKGAAEKPKIQRLVGPATVTKGSSLTLRCKAQAKPNPLFTWFHNGTEIIPARGQSIRSNRRGSRLKISKVSQTNSGVYTCLVRNALGEASKNITIGVNGSYFSDQTYNSYQYMNEDANATDFVSVPNHRLKYKECEKQTYCFNGGTCIYIPDLHLNQCQCPVSYEGGRCEKELTHSSILKGDGGEFELLRVLTKGEAKLLYERTLIIVGIVIALLVFAVICIASYFLANGRRKRREAKRRMRQHSSPEKDRLLAETEGVSPSFTPSKRPLVQKETQTDIDSHPPHPPPRREHESEPNFTSNHPDNSHNIFLRDGSFPLITKAEAAVTASQPLSSSNHRPSAPVTDPEVPDLERKGSRFRLKAVSVDDSYQDRPLSWKPGCDVPDSKSMPLIRDGDRDQDGAIEKDTFGSRPAVSSSSPSLSHGDDSVQPVGLSSVSAEVKLEEKPQDNALALLKPSEKDDSPRTRSSDLPPDPSLATGPEGLQGSNPALAENTATLPVNGVGEDWDSDSEIVVSPLPRLHISEEDLNGNVSKPETFILAPPPKGGNSSAKSSSQSLTTTSSPTALRPKNLTTGQMDGMLVPSLGQSPGSTSEEDSAGFLPHTLSSNEVNSPLMGGSLQGETYAFDPCIDSDPNEFDDQFMHASPKRGPGPNSGAEDRQDYDRRLRNVRADQEAIPI